MNAVPSETLTFLFTDIEGSMRRWDAEPEAMPAALARHDDILRQTIGGFHGHVFKALGDAFYAVFANPHDAIAATLSAQRHLAREEWGTIDTLRVRMALHIGTAEQRDGDYFGPPLNRAARLLAAGHGG